MAKYCLSCADNRVYLNAVGNCPSCGQPLRAWEGGPLLLEPVGPITLSDVDTSVDLPVPQPAQRDQTRGTHRVGRVLSAAPWIFGIVLIALVVLYLGVILRSTLTETERGRPALPALAQIGGAKTS